MPSLPLNASGKIDHNKIRENLDSYMRGAKKKGQKPSESRSVPRESRNQARRDVDIQNFISKAWQDEIGLSETTSTDVNFFDMGGHRSLDPRSK